MLYRVFLHGHVGNGYDRSAVPSVIHRNLPADSYCVTLSPKLSAQTSCILRNSHSCSLRAIAQTLTLFKPVGAIHESPGGGIFSVGRMALPPPTRQDSRHALIRRTGFPLSRHCEGRSDVAIPCGNVRFQSPYQEIATPSRARNDSGNFRLALLGRLSGPPTGSAGSVTPALRIEKKPPSWFGGRHIAIFRP